MPCTSASLTRSLHTPRSAGRTVVTDVAVIGGGAIGTATAWLLARSGVRVVLLEERAVRAVRHAARGTAWSAHPSWLPPGAGTDLGVAVQLWRTLEAETGATVLRVADAADHGDIAALEARAARDPDAQWLQPGVAAARWPGTRFTGPVLYRRAGAVQVHADQAIAALTAAATGQGAVLRHRTRITAVEAVDDTRVEIRTRTGRVCARQVVLTGPADGLPDGTWDEAWEGARDGAREGIAALDPPQPVAGLELHFAPRLTGADPALTGWSAGADQGTGPAPDIARWPLLAHHHPELGLVRAVACTRGHIAVGVHGGPAATTPGDLREHVERWFPGLETHRTEPVVPPAMSTALPAAPAPVPVGRTGPVLRAGGAAVGSVLATVQGQMLADAVLGAVPVPSAVP